MRVEIFRSDELIAVGYINEQEAKNMNLVWGQDEVIRLSELLWETMIPEAKSKFLVKFNAKEIVA